MRGMMRWALPLVALTLMVGLSGSRVNADDAPAPQVATGTVSGTVTDKDGNPASGITVEIVPPIVTVKKGQTPAPAPKSDIGDRELAKTKDKPAKPAKKVVEPIATATTGADGSYVLTNVPPGDYLIQAGSKKITNGYASLPITIKGGDSLTQPLQLGVTKPLKMPHYSK